MCPLQRIDRSKMAVATILKSQKSRYLCNGLTNLYEIWYADAKWVKSDSAGAAGLASSNSLAPKHPPANRGLPHQYTQILLSTHRTAQCPLQ